MAITTDDFNKIWASASPLTPYSFSASQYKEGWNFIGSTPPSRQMWDFLQKNNDEKMQYLLNHFDNYLPLSGGTVTGDLTVTGALDGTASGNLPLSGGTLTGVVNGVTPTAGDNSKKLATTEFVNAKAGKYLPLSGGTVTGDLDVTSAITCNSVTSNRVNVRSGSVAPVNTLQRSTAYSVDDIVYTSKLNAKYYLLCVTAGTTSATMPSFSGAGSNTEVTDGTVVWRVQTITSQESVANISTGLTQAETRIDSLQNRVDKVEKTVSKVPTGVVQAFAGSTTPQGWLLCDGSAVSRTDYAALYAVIGTTYGAGDGSTTFNLPNLVDKFVEGSSTAGTVKSAGLPNITGTLYLGKEGPLEKSSSSGALSAHISSTNHTGLDATSGKYIDTLYFDASKSNAIYGKSNTVQPPALTMRYIIKY